MKKRLLAGMLVLVALAATVESTTGPDGQWLGGGRPRSRPRPEQPEPALEVKALPTPDDAVAWALADLLTLPPYDRQFTRYLWLPERQVEELKSVSLGLNLVSRAPAVYRPEPTADLALARVDLRWYAPEPRDLAEWLLLWEQFQFDPNFSLLITRDVIELLNLPDEQLPRVRVARKRTRRLPAGTRWRSEVRTIDHPGGYFKYPDDSGRFYPDLEAGRYRPELRFKEEVFVDTVQTVFEEVSFAEAKDVAVVRANSRSINPANFLRLQQLTLSEAPVVHYRYFLTRALTAIKDQGPYAVVWGGLYYDLVGIKKAKDVLGKDTKATDEDLFFENLGVGNIKAGLTADRLFEKLGSDQRSALRQSQVTGKPRRVDFFHVLSGKESNSWGSITHDIRRQDVDVGSHALLNLLTFQDFAREAIFSKANDLVITALFNGKGALQEVVPPDVATDRTVPAPYTGELQPVIGCLRCHAASGEDFWKPCGNDVRHLLGRKTHTGLDVVADFSDPRRLFDQDARVARIAGLYAGSFEKNMRRAREDWAEAVLKAVGPWPKGGDQTEVGKLASRRVCDDFEAYNYRTVDARQALRELGLEVGKEHAVAFFKALLPPDPRSRVNSVFLEDGRIAALRDGGAIVRADWAFVYDFAAERARHSPLWHLRKGVQR